MSVIGWIVFGFIAVLVGYFALVLLIAGVVSSPKTHGAKVVDAQLSEQYYYQKDSVVFVPGANFFSLGERAMEGVDKDSFTVLDRSHGKDRYQVFHEEKRIDDADPATVESIPNPDGQSGDKQRFSGYIKDHAKVFFWGKPLLAADPVTFQILFSRYSRDANNVYWWDERLVDDAINTRPVPGSDQYIQIDNRVFYRDQKLTDNGSQFRVLEHQFATDSNTIYFQQEPLPHIQASSFRVLSEHFSMDSENIFYDRKPMPGVNRFAFAVLDGRFGKDDSHVYYGLERIVGEQPNNWNSARAKTFFDEVFWMPLTVSNSEVIFADPKQVTSISPGMMDYQGRLYGANRLLSYAKPSDVQVFDQGEGYARIFDEVFCYGQKLEGADPETFEYLGNRFSRDAQHIYWDAYRVIDTTPNTFALENNLYAEEREDGLYYLAKSEELF